MMDNITVYHEKQKLQFCLLHALNNLLQEKDSFARAELDTIAEKLVINDPTRDNKWRNPLSLIFKPHHNIITGNYDVNVLISALEAKNYKVLWHDRRKKASSINLSEANLLGIIYNIPVRKLAGLWSGRHWVALRKISNTWYNLDSDFPTPQPFSSEDEVEAFLDEIIAHSGEILIVLHHRD